jgi:site-specific DNA-methyltransferase (adenine-specific)
MILYKGDCLIEMQNIESYSIDFILTDLPYGTTACSWDEIIPFEPMWNEFYRILRPNGFIALTASQPFTTKLINSNIERFSHQWIWKKEQGSNPLLANKMPMKNFEDVVIFGNEHKHDFTFRSPLRAYSKKVMEFIGLSLKQINTTLGHRKSEHFFYVDSTQFNICTEKTYLELVDVFGIDKMQCFTDYKTLKTENIKWLDSFPRVYNPQMTEGKEYISGGGYVKHLDQIVKGGNVSDKRYPTAIIEFATGKNKSVHPTQKPTALLEYLIKTYTNETMTVFDATMGSGSTGVACKNTNRNFIGIEKDDRYFEIAEKRINGTNANPNNFEKVAVRGQKIFNYGLFSDNLD